MHGTAKHFAIMVLTTENALLKMKPNFGYKVHALITLEGIIQTEKAGRNCVFTAKWPTQLPPAEAGGLLWPKGHFWATESRLQDEVCFFAT